MIDIVFPADSSLSWKDVEFGLELLMNNELWIPRIPTMKVTAKRMTLIKGVFFAHDAEEILKIRIPEMRAEVVLAWHYEKSNSLFTVRGTYRVALQEFLEEQKFASTSTSVHGSQQTWAKLWSTPVPQEIKIFAWRLTDEDLTTMQNKN